MTAIDITAAELARSMTLTFRLRGMKRFALRLRIAAWLFKLGCHVAGCNVVIEHGDGV